MSDQNQRSTPTFGDMEDAKLTFGDLEPPQPPAERAEELTLHDTPARPHARLGERLEVTDDPAYQDQTPSRLAEPDGTLAPEENLRGQAINGMTLLTALFENAFARLGQNEAIVWSLVATLMQESPQHPPRTVPILCVEAPSVMLGSFDTHALTFPQLSGWDQAKVDEAVRNVVEALREKRSAQLAELNGLPQQPPEHPGAQRSGIIVPGM